MPRQPYPARIRARAESRDAALRRLGHKSYRDYLSSPEWKAVRIRHRQEFSETCSLCECEGERTQLHHLTYERVGQELLGDLMRLCPKCHQMIHELERRGEIGLDFSGLTDLRRALKYAQEDRARVKRMNELPDTDEHSRQKRKLGELAQERLSLIRAKKRRNGSTPGIDHRIRKIDSRIAELL